MIHRRSHSANDELVESHAAECLHIPDKGHHEIVAETWAWVVDIGLLSLSCICAP